MCEHDPHWAAAFAHEAVAIRLALAEPRLVIHHIGSTSVPGLIAKPVIDMLLETRWLDDLDERTATLEQIGYVARGEYGIAGRRYFVKNGADGRRSHHLHAFMVGSAQITRYLSFRDCLIRSPLARRDYAAVKLAASRNGRDKEAYQSGKAHYIHRLLGELSCPSTE